MINLGQILIEKKDAILDRWVDSVRQDAEINSSKKLAFEEVRNNLPHVIEEIAKLLSPHHEGDLEVAEESGLEHGCVRAKQGYDTGEMVREYRLLNSVLVEELESELVSGTGAQVLDAMRTIDNTLDRVVSMSLDSYLQARLQEIEQMERQLVLNNRELNRLVRVHQNNLSYLAHELKVPLNSILGFSDVMLRQQRREMMYETAPMQLEYLERVLRNGRHTLKIINDALEICRYNAGELQVKPEEFAPKESIPIFLQETLEPLAQQKGLDFSIDVDRAPDRVRTDPLRFQQILTNLVSNAIKYTKEGKIELTCWQADDANWSLAVNDTGIGISPADRDRIFKSYDRVEIQNDSLESTGLGLAIVTRLLDLMQGQITIESELDRGSTFTVTLPLVVESDG